MSAPLIRTDDPGACPDVGTKLIGSGGLAFTVVEPGGVMLDVGLGFVHWYRDVHQGVHGPLTVVES